MSGTSMHDLLTLAEEAHGVNRLLLRSASVMLSYAREYCGKNRSVLSETCEPYHGWWQYWRLADLVATPNLHYRHYKDFLAGGTTTERQLLICGTADYGILDHLIQTIPRSRLDSTRIAVLDVCRTPLEMCSWYGAEYSSACGGQLGLSCHLGDALHPPFGSGAFDLITSYDFLPRFSNAEKIRVVREWQRMLRPGGRVVTTARLAPVSKEEVVDSEANDFPKHVLQQISDHKPWLLPAIETIDFLSREYSRTVVSRFSSMEYLYELFADFDCAINMMDLDTSFAGTERYACIVAVKN